MKKKLKRKNQMLANHFSSKRRYLRIFDEKLIALSFLCISSFLMEFQSLEQIKDLWLRCWPLLYLISNWSYVEKVNKCLRNLNNLQNLNISLNKTLYNQYIFNSNRISKSTIKYFLWTIKLRVARTKANGTPP